MMMELLLHPLRNIFLKNEIKKIFNVYLETCFRMNFTDVTSSLFDLIDEKRFPKLNEEERIATYIDKVNVIKII